MATWSVGTGQDFATWQLAEDFADSVNGTGVLSEDEIFQQINEELVYSTSCIWEGATPGVFNIVLEPAPGAGFADHVDAATNHIRYDPSLGASVRHDGGTSPLFTFNQANTIARGLMLKKESNYASVIEGLAGAAGRRVDNCILERDSAGSGANVLRVANFTVENCAVIVRTDGAVGVENNEFDCIFNNVSIVSTVANSSEGFVIAFGSPTLKNVVVSGFDIDYSGTANAASTNNATSLSSFGGTNFGANGQTSINPALEFESVTDGTHDLRLAATSVKLKDLGTSSGVPSTDIIGKSRTGSFDIGAWEFFSGGATTFPVNISLTGPRSPILRRSTTLATRTATSRHAQTLALLKVLLVSAIATCAHATTMVLTRAILIAASAISVRRPFVQRQGNLNYRGTGAHATPTLVGQGTIRGITADTVVNPHTARVTRTGMLNLRAARAAVLTLVVETTATIAVSVSTTVSHAVQMVRQANIFVRARSIYEQAALPTFISGGAKIYAIVVSATQSFALTISEQVNRLRRPFSGGAGLGIHMRIKRNFRPWRRK